jgi:ubiquitin C-terminal hydrolase
MDTPHQGDPPTPIISNQSCPVTAMEAFDLCKGVGSCPVMPNMNGFSSYISNQTPRFSSPDEEPIIVQRSSRLSPMNAPSSKHAASKETINNKQSRIITQRRHVLDWNILLEMLSEFVRSGWSLEVVRDTLRQLLSLNGPLFQNTLLALGAGNHNLLFASPPSSIASPSSFTLSERRKRRFKQQGLPKHIQGLPNQGQTCFMNSVLQSLASLSPFLAYLDGIVQCQEEMKEAGIAMTADPLDLTSGKTSFCRRLLDLLDDVNTLEEEVDDDIVNEEQDDKTRVRQRRWRRQRKSLNPKPLLQMIGERSEQFKSKPFALMEQQDAQELLSALLESVVEDAHLDGLLDRRFLHDTTSNRESTMSAVQQDLARSNLSTEADEDNLMTSALANSFLQEEEAHRDRVLAADLGSSSTGLAMEEANSVLSLSGFLLQMESEQHRNAARNHGHSMDTLCAVKPPLCIQQEKQFQEEKKQDHGDDAELVSAVSTPKNEILFHTFSRPEMRTSLNGLRHTISAITPSPLAGWLGSTVQCVKCQRVRPIQNAPFSDIPLVPTSVPSYIARAYHSPSQSAAPNSRSLPPCSLDECLSEFTSVEAVKDVECRFCTIQREREQLEEEAMMLRGAIETMEKRLEKKSVSNGLGARSAASSNQTKYLLDDLRKVEGRLLHLDTMDPEEDDVLGLLGDQFSGHEQFFDLADKPNAAIERCVARKCLLLTRTPSVLCCHIQRRYYDPFTNRMEKCLQHVDFPEVLDISPYCAYGPRANTPWAAGSSTSATNEPRHCSSTNLPSHRDRMLYRLQSVIEHRGNAYGGHYICYRRNQPGQWHLISDEAIHPVSWLDVRSSQAYLLFYQAL